LRLLIRGSYRPDKIAKTNANEVREVQTTAPAHT